jgi:hypothetical protein
MLTLPSKAVLAAGRGGIVVAEGCGQLFHEQRFQRRGILRLHRAGHRLDGIDIGLALLRQGLDQCRFLVTARHGLVLLPGLLGIGHEALHARNGLGDVGRIRMQHGAVEHEAGACQPVLGIVQGDAGQQLVRVHLFERALGRAHAVDADQASRNDDQAEQGHGGDQADTEGQFGCHTGKR